jgi:hypothetical protein
MKEQILEQDLTREYEALYIRCTTKIFEEKAENRTSRFYLEVDDEIAKEKGYKFDERANENIEGGSKSGMWYYEHSGLCANSLESTNLKDALEEIKSDSFRQTNMYDINTFDFAIFAADECWEQDAEDGICVVAKSMNILYVREY